MKTYIRVEKESIVQVWDYRDLRYETIIKAIKGRVENMIEVELSDEQIDEITNGEKYDYINGRIVPHTPTPEELAIMLEVAKSKKIEEITVYDKSDEVNRFFVNELGLWLDRETRTSLARTIAIDKEAGETKFTIWYEELTPVRFDIPIALAQPMLDALERYAKDTYNVTQEHKAAVCQLGTIEAVNDYDHTAGYPKKLEFNF